MRAEVAESWQRSAAAGVARDSVDAPVTIDAHDLRDLREAHPLFRVFPLLDEVIGQAEVEHRQGLVMGGQHLVDAAAGAAAGVLAARPPGRRHATQAASSRHRQAPAGRRVLR